MSPRLVESRGIEPLPHQLELCGSGFRVGTERERHHGAFDDRRRCSEQGRGELASPRRARPASPGTAYTSVQVVSTSAEMDAASAKRSSATSSAPSRRPTVPVRLSTHANVNGPASRRARASASARPLGGRQVAQQDQMLAPGGERVGTGATHPRRQRSQALELVEGNADLGELLEERRRRP